MDIPTVSDVFPVGRLKAECLGLDIPGINQSLWNMFAVAADKHLNEEALSSLWQPTDHLSSRLKIGQTDLETHLTPITNENGVGTISPKSCSAPLRWSFAQLREKAESLATWLQQLGCIKGDNLVVFVWNSAEWVLFLWAAARLKMPFVPLDPRSSDKYVMKYLSLAPPQVLESSYITFESFRRESELAFTTWTNRQLADGKHFIYPYE
ncbi:hypothetical protein EAF00_007736 [Botryotinia globosa]|nr:hypothetical protein EAF00_007736 [Botryotinia globosa]